MASSSGSVPADLLNGQRYLASLQDAREVYIYGERVPDVTRHPTFRNSCRSIARLYDALHDPQHRNILPTVDHLGHRTHKFFKPSATAQELLEAREALISSGRPSYGFIGRTPAHKDPFQAPQG